MITLLIAQIIINSYQFGAGTPVIPDAGAFILQEDGAFLMQQDGVSKIYKQFTAGGFMQPGGCVLPDAARRDQQNTARTMKKLILTLLLASSVASLPQMRHSQA